MGFEGFLLLVFVIGLLRSYSTIPMLATLASRMQRKWTWNATLTTVIICFAGLGACAWTFAQYGIGQSVMWTDLTAAFLSGLFLGPILSVAVAFLRR